MYAAIRSFSQRILIVPLLTLLLAAAGCGGSKLYPVEGDVHFKDGKPLKGGMVIFEPKGAEGETPLSGSSGLIDEEGHFKMRTFKDGDGAFPGLNRVRIAPPYTGGDSEKGNVPEVIHSSYKTFQTSGLEFEVTTDRSKNYYKIVIDRPDRKK